MERCKKSLHRVVLCEKMFRAVRRHSKMFPSCSKILLTVLNRLPWLLNLCQRTDPVIILRNVRIVNGTRPRTKQKALKSADFKAFGAAGQDSFAFSFSRGGSKKRIKVFASVCTGSCRPPMWPADMIRICPEKEKHRRPYGLAVFFWSCWADSNCRPHPYQGCALPTELQQQSTCPLKRGMCGDREGT